MIYGIGVDMVEIERMNDSHMRDYVINRLFHPAEIESIPQLEQRKKRISCFPLCSKRSFRESFACWF